MRQYLKYIILFFTLCNINSFCATYTWNKANGGQWYVTTNWTPTSPLGGPPSGSDIIIPALSNNSRVITDVPQITLNSLTCSGTGTSWLTAAASGNTITITSTWNVPSSHTLTIGASGERLCWKLLNTSTSIINGYVAFDAGSTTRNFDVYGTISVNATGCIYDPNPSGGSDFNFYSGCTLKTQKPQGFTKTSATDPTNINYNVAFSIGGTYSYMTGVNFEYNGTVDQITGMGLNQNTAANLVINNSPGKVVTLSGNTQLSGSLTINANSLLSASSYSLSIGATTGAGGFVNNGTFSAGSGSVIFNGNAPQIISGTTTTTFNNLVLNNNNGLTLSTPSQLTGSLTLTSGLLNTTNTNLLILLSGAVAPALTNISTSYINGPMKYQKSTSGISTLNFPIGKSPDCRPIQLNVNHVNSNPYNYLGESFNASANALNYTLPPTIDTVSTTHYWDMTRTDNSNVNQPSLDLAGSQTVKLYFGPNDKISGLASLKIAKNTNTATTTWIDLSGSASGTITNGNIISGGFNSFSRFTLAHANSNPLPISLIEFSGTCMNNYIQLKWSTATEHNNHHFILERNADGVNWKDVAEIPGNGTTVSESTYFFNDFTNKNDLSYYRLSQVDINQKITRYNIISMECDYEKPTQIFFPNPLTRENTLYINTTANKLGSMNIKIFEATGKLVYSRQIQSPSKDDSIELPDVNLPSGIYIININNEISKLIVM